MPLLEDLEEMEDAGISNEKKKTGFPGILMDVVPDDESGKKTGMMDAPIGKKAERTRCATTDDLFLA